MADEFSRGIHIALDSVHWLAVGEEDGSDDLAAIRLDQWHVKCRQRRQYLLTIEIIETVNVAVNQRITAAMLP